MVIKVIIAVFFIIAIGFYNSYLLLEEDMEKESRDVKLAWQISSIFSFIVFAFTFQYFQCMSVYSHYIFSYGWQYSLFSLSVFWLVFPGLVYVTGLKKSFFYVGVTAYTDKAIQFFSRKTRLNPSFLSAALKILLFVKTGWQCLK